MCRAAYAEIGILLWRFLRYACDIVRPSLPSACASIASAWHLQAEHRSVRFLLIIVRVKAWHCCVLRRNLDRHGQNSNPISAAVTVRERRREMFRRRRLQGRGPVPYLCAAAINAARYVSKLLAVSIGMAPCLRCPLVRIAVNFPGIIAPIVCFMCAISIIMRGNLVLR